MYEVLLERRAERNLDDLDSALFKRVVREIEGLRNNPRPRGSRKLVGTKADWRIRVGDYRVVYEIDDRTESVRVMYIRHRRDAYR